MPPFLLLVLATLSCHAVRYASSSAAATAAFVPIAARAPPPPHGAARRLPSTFALAASSSSAPPPPPDEPATPPTSREPEPPGPILDQIPAPFRPLFAAASSSTSPRDAVTTASGHDPFRYEWGTWVDADAMQELMDRVDEVRLNVGAYDALMARAKEDGGGGGSDEEKDSSGGGSGSSNKPTPVQYTVASGRDWSVLLHLLPNSAQYRHRWPTGSWSIVKPLIGVGEVAMLRGPDRDGLYRKSTAKDLRGGSDGSFVGGGGGGGGVGGNNKKEGQEASRKSVSGGVDCVKYVGGPTRSYEGKSGKTAMLEVVIRPPVSASAESEVDYLDGMFELDDIDSALSIVVDEPEDEEGADDAAADSASGGDDKDDDEDDDDSTTAKQSLGSRLGMTFERVGGLDAQLDSIVRRVLASRANPEAARRLGVSHVRGILLSGPPGCGKTLLARELAALLGAREPQIVNGPEILDKFIGEAEKRVRDLFVPAEQEYKQVGDDSALHLIILDEMDAIARKRGSASSDTTGVRDSVVNQLLAKMDGVREANNVLVVGMTNRPELLDPALLRPGRLEVQLQVELPDSGGRRDILRIHTRRMREAGGVSEEAATLLEDLGEDGIAARSEHFTGAELAGLVRSAASFALARAVEEGDGAEGKVSVADLEEALGEVRPALGRQDEVLKLRYPLGMSPCSSSMERIMRDLERFVSPVPSKAPRLQSLLLVGAGGNGGAGATALAAWAATLASSSGAADYVRFVTALDLLADGGGGDEARAAALVERFGEAREMPHALLVLDDVDQLCAGSGQGGYSSVMIATLRALLRTPPSSSATAKAGGHSKSKKSGGKTLQIIAATSRSDAACHTLNELFEETIVVPLLSDADSVHKLLSDGLYPGSVENVEPMADLIIERLGSVGCKTALRLAERAIATAGTAHRGDELGMAQMAALDIILEDLAGDEVTAEKVCEIF